MEQRLEDHYERESKRHKGSGLGFDGAHSDAAQSVAVHYNSLADRHRTLTSGSDILHVRNLHNWIKSVLIGRHLRPGAAVLDLACGKGGDMQKFRVGECATYCGVDIALQSVRDAVGRYNGCNGRPGMPFTGHFAAADFCDARLSSVLPPGVTYQASLSLPISRSPSLAPRLSPLFPTRDSVSTRDAFPLHISQLVSCQFAVHYAFATEARAEAMLANVASQLEPGGFFVGTTPDANVLVSRLRAAPELSFGNGRYQVAFNARHSSKRFDAAAPFGIGYRFSLNEAVDDCEEYLVHLPAFERLARKHGLQLLFANNFTDFFAQVRRPLPSELPAYPSPFFFTPTPTPTPLTPLPRQHCREHSNLVDKMRVLPENDFIPEEDWEVREKHHTPILLPTCPMCPIRCPMVSPDVFFPILSPWYHRMFFVFHSSLVVSPGATVCLFVCFWFSPLFSTSQGEPQLPRLRLPEGGSPARERRRLAPGSAARRTWAGLCRQGWGQGWGQGASAVP